ncbi:hypothetical protein QBC37DRAFT_415982 [Rhypophila decipiens]|uniref:Uncharacterized protein n=1 Tax=Rhypophila decipiens TaxID=261697 RepID=A0AAN7BAJ4_9PEZI|nr:hypothetical protein QBC37DRAFT_415982 [Rhypophila decipiens]
MSWALLPERERYEVFRMAALKETLNNRPADYRFPVTIWEVNDNTLQPKLETDVVGELAHHLKPPKSPDTAPQVRIIFAPLDEVLRDLEPGITALCRALCIPPEFLSERLRGVCHSFGTRTDQNGYCVWFHYLCKAVELELRHRWYKSAFFLRQDRQGNVTLVCFGAAPLVRKRLEQCMQNGYWTDIQTEPLVLYDLVLDGLFAGLDRTVWDLLDVIRRLERDVLVAQGSKGRKPVTADQINFPELHNWAKHLIELSEVMESSLLVVDGTLSCVGKSTNTRVATAATVQCQLRESLHYRQSLFMSTKLRLHSLEKRVSNTITLAFNTVTQQDSRLMRQDSASMTIISFMTLLFLPTAGVATILGSQFFGTDHDSRTGTTSVSYTSPLFYLMWWIAIPLTVVAVLIAVFYRHSISIPVWKNAHYSNEQKGGQPGTAPHKGNDMKPLWTWRGYLGRQPVPPTGQPTPTTGGNISINGLLLNSQQSSGLVSV